MFVADKFESLGSYISIWMYTFCIWCVHIQYIVTICYIHKECVLGISDRAYVDISFIHIVTVIGVWRLSVSYLYNQVWWSYRWETVTEWWWLCFYTIKTYITIQILQVLIYTNRLYLSHWPQKLCTIFLNPKKNIKIYWADEKKEWQKLFTFQNFSKKTSWLKFIFPIWKIEIFENLKDFPLFVTIWFL